MNKQVITSESDFTTINEVGNKTMKNLKVATFCVVTKVNNNKTLNAQPVVLEQISTPDGSKQYMKLPEILNVPYHLSDNPKKGDFCVLIHLDLGIGSFTKDQLLNGAAKNDGNNRHTLTNCIAICGFLE